MARWILRGWVGLWMLCLSLSGVAQAAPPEACFPPGAEAEQPAIFLVSMTPGGAIWNSYGHNGLWIRVPGKGDGVVFNFGVFVESNDMLDDWLQGRQYYWLATRTYDSMVQLYQGEQRNITAQRLNLPPEMAKRFIERLGVLIRPENRQYRYHWSENNCSTKIRDLLDEVSGGQLIKQHQEPNGVTMRKEVLRYTSASAAVWFGLHFMTGKEPDRALTWWESMFLPERLHDRLAVSTLRWPDGSERPLIAYECDVVSGGIHGAPRAEAPRWWGWLLLIGLVLGGISAGLGHWRRGGGLASRLLFSGWLGLAGLLLGGLGTLGVWLWSASALVAFEDNTNLVLANPLHLLWFAAAVLVMRKGARPRAVAWWIGVTLLVIAVLGSVVNLFLPQDSLDLIALFVPYELGLAAALWWSRGEGGGAPTPSAS